MELAGRIVVQELKRIAALIRTHGYSGETIIPPFPSENLLFRDGNAENSDIFSKANPNQPRVAAGQPGGGQWLGNNSGKPKEAPQQVAGEIKGFTRHGINQAINRNIAPIDILDAVNNPLSVVPRGDGSTQYKGRNATIVLNPAGIVITMWPQ